MEKKEPCFVCGSDENTERIFPRGVMFGDVYHGHPDCFEDEDQELLDDAGVRKYLAGEVLADWVDIATADDVAHAVVRWINAYYGAGKPDFFQKLGGMMQTGAERPEHGERCCFVITVEGIYEWPDHCWVAMVQDQDEPRIPRRFLLESINGYSLGIYLQR